MQILNSTLTDIDDIYRLYKSASEHQRKIGAIIWPTFERAMIEREINTFHQWKLVIDDQIACIWATTFSDEHIWEDRNADPSVYIHRIATNPAFRGNNFVQTVVDWAVPHAKSLNKEFVRLDTLSENARLIKHYTGAGFDYLGMFDMMNTAGLPAHYHGEKVALFQIAL